MRRLRPCPQLLRRQPCCRSSHAGLTLKKKWKMLGASMKKHLCNRSCTCTARVRQGARRLGKGEWYRYCRATIAQGGLGARVDTRCKQYRTAVR